MSTIKFNALYNVTAEIAKGEGILRSPTALDYFSTTASAIWKSSIIESEENIICVKKPGMPLQLYL